MRKSRSEHRLSKRPVYKVWSSMRRMCLKPEDSRYHNFGGKGIGICGRWEKFENFFIDLGDKPEGMTLSRHDETKNFEPGNCYWSPRKGKICNNRARHTIKHEGRELTIPGWSKLLGIKIPTIRYRIAKGKTTAEILRPMTPR